jgi:hypothetical protein
MSAAAVTVPGRWSPTPVVQLVTDRPAWDATVPYSTQREACILMSGEQVLVDDRWRTIDRPVCIRSQMGPAQTLLYLTDGGIVGSRFDFPFVSRDADEQALADRDEAPGFKVGDVVLLGGKIRWIVAEVGPCTKDSQCIGDMKIRDEEWPEGVVPVCIHSSKVSLWQEAGVAFYER